MSNDNYPPEEEELQGPVPEPENPLGGPVADGDLGWAGAKASARPRKCRV